MRTLVVSPERFVEPGATVRATFSFTNLGGGPAKGLRVRFSLPEGLTYLVDSAQVDGEPLDDLAGVGALVKTGGVDVGDVPPGAERKISLAYVVAPTIENDTVVEIQAAISSFEVPPVGSNIVRLIVRSKPKLQNEKTYVCLQPVRDAAPGGEAIVSARIRNVGESSANGVVLVLPTPIGAAYIPNTAQIDGAELDDLKRRDPFGYAAPVTVARKLGPGATVTAQYRVRIDPVLPDATEIVARASVSSLEIGEFDLPEAKIVVSSSPSFEGEETCLEVRHPGGALVTEDEVKPGQLLSLRVRGCNVGTACAHDVFAEIELPAGLAYAPGSLCVDGQAFPDPHDALRISLGEIEPGALRAVDVVVIVTAPIANGLLQPIVAHWTWIGGSRTFTRSLSVSSKPRFSPTCTRLRRLSSPVLEPNEIARYQVDILNDGSLAAEDAALVIHRDDRLEELEANEGDRRLEIKDGTISLGTMQPHAVRTVSIAGRVRSPLADGTEIRFRAGVVAADCAPYALPEQVISVRARPRFVASSSFLHLLSQEALRPDHVCVLAVRLRNEGNDRANDVCVLVRHSPELRMEAVEGATRDGMQIVFGDIEPGESREATIRLRLLHLVPHGFTADVHASIVGRSLAPIVLEPVTLQTHAEANFSDSVSLFSMPRDAVDAGAELRYTLVLRNTGDGEAKRLMVNVRQPNATTYVPLSTCVNGRTLLDHGGTSLLWSQRGLVLNDIAPGVEVVVTWLSIVNMPLPPDTVIHVKAMISYDNGEGFELEAKPVIVHSSPLFSLTENDLPFWVTGAPVPALMTEPFEMLPAPEMRSLTALPSPRGIVSGTFVDAPERMLESSSGSICLATEFSQERLDRTLRFLEGVGGRSLLTHLFALRAFFPGIADGSPRLDTLLEGERAVLRRILDRLYVKLHAPELELLAEDLEDDAARGATVRLLYGLADERSIAPASQRSGIVRIVGSFDPSRAASLLDHLADAPLGSVAPWYALAHLLGKRLESEDFQGDLMGAYRTALIAELGALVSKPIEAFHQALALGESKQLDAKLHDLLDSFEVRA